MEVRRGTSSSEANPVRVRHDEAASLATQPTAAAAVLPVGAQLVPGPGTVLNDRYELARVIGCGGMSTVHRAYDRRTGREVAVKISRPAAETVDADGRTRREVDLMTALDNPGLVAVLLRRGKCRPRVQLRSGFSRPLVRLRLHRESLR